MGLGQTRFGIDWNDSATNSETDIQNSESEWVPLSGDNPREVAKRIKRAAELNATVTPVAPGMYHVTSKSGETYVVDLDAYAYGEERGVCECRDYRYRAAANGHDCKHVIVAKQQVRAGLLPPPSYHPVEWLNKQLDDITCQPLSDNDSKLVEKMRGSPYYIEFRQFLRQLESVSIGGKA